MCNVNLILRYTNFMTDQELLRQIAAATKPLTKKNYLAKSSKGMAGITHKQRYKRKIKRIKGRVITNLK
jgi:hypothetical protein